MALNRLVSPAITLNRDRYLSARTVISHHLLNLKTLDRNILMLIIFLLMIEVCEDRHQPSFVKSKDS